MTEALERTAYTPRRLALYDAVILGLSCRLVWKCPRRHMLELCNRHVGTPHLEVARKALGLYNREGAFTNVADSLDGL